MSNNQERSRSLSPGRNSGFNSASESMDDASSSENVRGYRLESRRLKGLEERKAQLLKRVTNECNNAADLGTKEIEFYANRIDDDLRDWIVEELRYRGVDSEYVQRYSSVYLVIYIGENAKPLEDEYYYDSSDEEEREVIEEDEEEDSSEESNSSIPSNPFNIKMVMVTIILMVMVMYMKLMFTSLRVSPSSSSFPFYSSSSSNVVMDPKVI